MSLRPRNPLGGNGVIGSQSRGSESRLGGAQIQAKRFGGAPSATPRKALGDLGNVGQGGLKESAKKPTPLLVVSSGGGGGVLKERAMVPRQGGKILNRRSRALEDELAGGLKEWGDEDSGEDDIEVEHMHLPAPGHANDYDQSPWPKGCGPADDLDVLLRPWSIDMGGGRRRAPYKDTAPFANMRSSTSDLDAVLDDSVSGFDDGDDMSSAIAVDLPNEMDLMSL